MITSLVSSVASAYYQLRELDLEMEISRQTLASRQESLRLVKVRQQGGVTSMMDVRQSEQLVYFAAASIPDLERRIEQQENFISVLIGKNPGPITRGKPLGENAIPATVPVGLPSTLLERRPDIIQAEQLLVAANARIGVAKAAYFPQIALTGTGGYQSSSLANLFTIEGGFWNAGAQLTQPIFEGGRIRSGVRLSEAQQQEAALFYKQTIQLAFREVSDSLVAYAKNQEFRQQEELLTQAAEDATRLSNARYTGGAASYLEVLDSDTRYFSARLNLAQVVLHERLALVQLYSARAEDASSSSKILICDAFLNAQRPIKLRTFSPCPLPALPTTINFVSSLLLLETCWSASRCQSAPVALAALTHSGRLAIPAFPAAIVAISLPQIADKAEELEQQPVRSPKA